jgi:hypothetical protein
VRGDVARVWIGISLAMTAIGADCDPDCTQPDRIQSGTYEGVGSGDRRVPPTTPVFVHQGIPGRVWLFSGGRKYSMIDHLTRRSRGLGAGSGSGIALSS